MNYRYTSLIFPLIAALPAFAQCEAGEVEVTIAITTDLYGYETYWQLVPGQNACGDGTIFEGGNLLVGCGGGGAQEQEPGGYASSTTITEGPWCLDQDAAYDIHMIDDWGDGQASAEVFINGVSVGVYAEEGTVNIHTFGAPRDMSVTRSFTPLFTAVNGTTRVRGVLRNFGYEPVTSFELSYAVDGGAPAASLIGGVDLQGGDTYEFLHDIPWIPAEQGTSNLDVWVSAINGAEDLNPGNDVFLSQHVISNAIPDLALAYLEAEPVITVVATSDHDVLVPRDLAFHPDGSRNQLWVINKDTEASGGSTVTFFDAGGTGQTHQWRKDVNSWHFMNTPTGIAMGDNDCFATSPGIFDANQNEGDPFTGPSLWSADTAIYCRFYGGLGSHLDMLHVDPQSQGIAHEFWNRYWVMSGFRGDIVMNDFREDHGPGNNYHGDAIIKRYADFTFTKDPQDHVVSHNILDKSTGWLYVVDFGGQRVLRLNTNTGTISGPGIYGPWEDYVEYSMVTGYEWEAIITEGLLEPAGIELVGTHLYVSDHANGDIIIYDISGTDFGELGRIHTFAPGLMGITVGPDGRIWGVNATNHTVSRVDPQAPSLVHETSAPAVRCWPNPADDRVYLELPSDMPGAVTFILSDNTGRTVQQGSFNTTMASLATGSLPAGTYALELRSREERSTVRISIMH